MNLRVKQFFHFYKTFGISRYKYFHCINFQKIKEETTISIIQWQYLHLLVLFYYGESANGLWNVFSDKDKNFVFLPIIFTVLSQFC